MARSGIDESHTETRHPHWYRHLLEMAMFAVVSFLIAALGVIPMAAHSIAGNLNWLTYVIYMGMGAAAGIRVGFSGQQRYSPPGPRERCLNSLLATR